MSRATCSSCSSPSSSASCCSRRTRPTARSTATSRSSGAAIGLGPRRPVARGARRSRAARLDHDRCVLPEFGRDADLNSRRGLDHGDGSNDLEYVTATCWGPDFARNRIVEDDVQAIDVCPTVCELLGASAAKGARQETPQAVRLTRPRKWLASVRAVFPALLEGVAWTLGIAFVALLGLTRVKRARRRRRVEPRLCRMPCGHRGDAPRGRAHVYGLPRR